MLQYRAARVAWFVLGASLVIAQNQRPVIAPHGLVNAASYQTDVGPRDGIPSSAIATIFGESLSVQTVSAASLPLPRQLGGTVVTLNGVPMPLFFVSPNQINFQVPYLDLNTFSTDPVWGGPRPIQLVVTTSAGASDPYPLSSPAGPGLFSIDGTGCGQAAVLKVTADGSTSVNSSSNSASPGDFISIYATGLGAVDNPPPNGQPPDATHPGRAVACCGLLIGGKSVFSPYPPLAPGLVGVFQINARLPLDTPEGCAIPLVINTGVNFYGTNSQDLSIAVHKGAGPCVDPPKPPSSFGILEWRKTQASGFDPDPSGEWFTATFLDPPDPRFSPPPFPAPAPVQCACRTLLAPLGRSCPQFQSRPLDAGSITVQPAAVDRMNVPRTSSLAYQTPLANGTLRAGTFSAAGSGGLDVGPFQSSLVFPTWPPFTLQTTFPPDTNIPLLQPLTIQWTGGRPNDIVRLQLTATRELATCECSAPASAGSLTLRTMQPVLLANGKIAQGLFQHPSIVAELTVTMQSDDAEPNAFTAAGLGLGGRHRWVYEYRFGQLTVR